MGKVVVILPAYNAAATLAATIAKIPPCYDHLIVGDDKSQDDTVSVSKALGLETVRHKQNRGYGGNQKSLYDHALSRGADVVIMVHPDDQYDTACLPEMIEKISSGKADIVMGSRMRTARRNGMPLWRYVPNRFLTWWQKLVFNRNLSEFHTGLRGYSAKLLSVMPYDKFSDKFVFDSELLAWSIAHDYKISEVDTNCYYAKHVSSIRFWPSMRYGLETLRVLWRFKRGDYRRMIK